MITFRIVRRLTSEENLTPDESAMLNWLSITIEDYIPPISEYSGTSNTVNGITAATNWNYTLPNGKHLLVAVFVSDAKADLETREGVIACTAKSAYEAFLQ